MRDIRKRVKRLEAIRKLRSPCIASLPAEIEKAALEKLSAADRALFRAKKIEGVKNTPEYDDMLIRWEAALSAASWAAGVPYLSAMDRMAFL